MEQFRIGDITVTRIEELIGPLFDPTTFFPDYDAAVFAQHRNWLYPDHVDEQSGRIIASMHSWLIQTPHHTVLVDTCIGNDKDRMPYRDWHEMKTPWLERLKAAGVSREDVDYVMCTHLHVDHVGWNTMLVNGEWVPTFPNARYVFARTEYEFWKQERETDAAATFNSVGHKTFDDSVLPVMDQAQLVDGELDLIADLLRIRPAPGHTPGSITIGLTSGVERGLFTGDILHHPIQVVEPGWNSAFCELPDQARATRQAVLEYCERTGALMLPAHFGPGFAGHVCASADGFRFEFEDQ